MNINKIVFFSYGDYTTAIQQYRIIGPLKEAGIEIVKGIDNGEFKPMLIQDCDIVLIQRDFAKAFEDFQTISWMAKSTQKPLVLDLDDAILSLPEEHPDRITSYYAAYLPGVLHAVIDADLVTVSTENLKKELLGLNPNIEVLPNFLDTNLWNFKTQRSNENDNLVKILYMGSATHQPEIELMSEALVRVAKESRKKIEFIFVGVQPPEKLREVAEVTSINDMSYVYKNFVDRFSEIKADFAIAPLSDNPFNRAKSPIKYLEYSVNGIPGVYSTIEPYSTVIRDGYNGLLAKSERQWFAQIMRLIEDQELRESIVRNSQQNIKNHYLLEKNASRWREVYEGIQERKPKAKVIEKESILSNLSSVAHQIAELVDNYESKNAQLNNQIQEYAIEKEQLLEHHQNERDRLEMAIENLCQERDDFIQQKNTLTKKKEDFVQQKNTLTREIEKLTSEKESLLAANQGLQDRVTALKEKNKEREEELYQLAWSLKSAKAEIADYTTSTSWVLTRPFRRIARLIKRRKNA